MTTFPTMGYEYYAVSSNSWVKSKYASLKLNMNETPRRVDVPAYNPVPFNNDLAAVDGKKQNIYKESTSMQ